MVSTGTNGYSWLFATNGIYGIRLSFGATWIDPGGADARAYGFQLRCLSE
ncbi:hypothetical protein [uncultured Rikenella sp.]|nr:hypothetical protein [uncultured Rikenella sp.]